MDAVRIDCNGVPFFWVEAPPPYRVTLQFRVGRADEPLAAAGVTHLCEHLALCGFQSVSYPYNGRVELHRTVFVCEGTADESRTFFEQVCRRLRLLPVDHLEREKKILRVEAAERQKSIVDAMLFDRFGARTYGLSWFPEFGMSSLGADAVREWASRWFTRANAAGWVVGPEPVTLPLALPEGRRSPPPAPVPRTISFPAVVRRPSRIVGASAVVPRSAAATLAVSLITAHLQRTLRFEMGSAYHVLPVYFPLTVDAAYVSMTSELAELHPEEPARAFLATIEGTATHGPREDDLEAQRAVAIARLDGRGWEMLAADAAAFQELLGGKYSTRERLRAGYRSTSVDQIRAVAGEMLHSVLYQVPPGLDVRLDGATPLPEWSSWAADGVVFEPQAGLPDPQEQFVLGEDGLTVWVGDRPLSVAWDRLAAVLSWSDGGRQVMGEDGFRINVVPTRVKRGRDLVTMIDAHAPQAVRVPVGKRMAVPVPPLVRRDGTIRRRWSRQQNANFVLIVVLALLLAPLFRRYLDGWDAVKVAGLALTEILAVAGLAALLALGRRADTSVGGGAGGVEVYDQATFHRKRLPAGVPTNRSYVRGGHLLAFLVLHDLTSEWFTAESGTALDRLRCRNITGPDLYEDWGGVLASDMLSAVGNEFVFDILSVRSRSSRFARLIRRVAGPDGGLYHLPTGWDVYDRLSPLLEDELTRWRRWRPLYRIARYVQAPPVF